jgi:rare lipoprotein A (peptidoglycan hydrolase)
LQLIASRLSSPAFVCSFILEEVSMIARAIRVFPGAMVALILSVAPSYADHAPAKQKIVQTRQRTAQNRKATHWRLLHPRSASADDYEVQGTILSDNDAPTSPHAIESGIASWYGGWFNGRRTSSGQRYDQNELTAAHPWLPLGSKVRVRLVGTDRSVDVTIIDRPGTRRRIIDLSREAARQLGMIHYGTALVTLSQN